MMAFPPWVDEGIVPIINENDTVSVEEIKIGDNDTLAAQSAVLWSADLLILFSDIDGLYDKSPGEHPDAQLVAEVRDIAATKDSISIGKTNRFGTGGIATKLEAAEWVVSYGIPMILAHGGRLSRLQPVRNRERRFWRNHDRWKQNSASYKKITALFCPSFTPRRFMSRKFSAAPPPR
jgi:glutamate 5-kinase